LVATISDVLAAAPDCRLHLEGPSAAVALSLRRCRRPDRIDASDPSPVTAGSLAAPSRGSGPLGSGWSRRSPRRRRTGRMRPPERRRRRALRCGDRQHQSCVVAPTRPGAASTRPIFDRSAASAPNHARCRLTRTGEGCSSRWGQRNGRRSRRRGQR
jgi:hypothetical protein